MPTPRTRPTSSMVTTLLVAALPLTSCGLFAKVLGVPTDCERYIDDVPFATSDRILRGAWHGTVEGLPVAGETRTVELDLTASRVDEDRYEISGAFGLEGEAPARIDGTVSGGCAERYLAVSTSSALSSARSDLSPESLPPSATLAAEVRDAADTTLWRVSAHGPGYAGNLLQEGALVLDIASVTDRDVRGQATIVRVEEP